MSAEPKTPPAGRWTAFIVLAIALAATAFCGWREHEIARRGLVIRWQEGFGQLQPVLQQLLAQRFETLHDQAKDALRRENFSGKGWNDFLENCEWQQRFPGMHELGYAELDGEKCIVKFVTTTNFPLLHPPGSDLAGDPLMREAVQKSVDAGHGFSVPPAMRGTNQIIIGLLNISTVDQRPAAAAQNRANLRGFIFFVLDQREYLQFCQPQLKNLPFTIRLLAPDEVAPVRTPDQRSFGNGGSSGDWRFVGTMKSPAGAVNVAQWIVVTCGTALSFLMFWLFSTQARMRMEAEASGKKLSQREVEITALNRDLEQKVGERTAQLHEALAEEKELNRLKGNFISMVTHEIRTPLALILGSSEILSRYLDRLAPEKRAEHLQTIDSAVGRMSNLLEDVLLFSKAEAGRMEFNPVQMDLKSFSSQMADELTSATNRRCPIELDVEGISEPARADENLLRHVLANLLTNAVKYSPVGAPVKFIVSRAAGDAVFVIRDRGMGIPGEDHKRIFTPFYRSKNVATIQGTGLGLVIVKHCVERHGGTLEIASIEKQGTTVTVRLPLFSPAHTEFVKRLSDNQNP